ncbi:MAG TPA: TPM domain-containing protein [Chitinophagales bacterium]|jgi:uncharacterized protein|nr:TPM domain-containing protein [Chitinophagales bacterium]HQV78697.1 TPM domain-containing protein [Chitinophagales bacterium]HQW78917.1 TPM domain-containing protein [Chitinophagales bacterium]HRB67377.1 TPM domain-containing protein [Chitinophagales bacterium]HRB69026.1 TPM domain-containing protein [Chitinophagales bacterium]
MKFHLNKIFLIFGIIFHAFAFAQVVDNEGIPLPPQPPKLVNDYAEMFSVSNCQNLEDKLVAYNDSTSTQICVVTVNNIGDYDISDYALRLGRSWGIGQKDKNNGILILVSKNDRKVDIEIGYGLESSITDYESKEIIDQLIVPAFKQGQYFQGIDEACNRIIAQLEGNYESTSYSSSNSAVDKMPDWVFIIVFAFIFIIVLSIIFSGKSTVSIGGGGWTWTSGSSGSSWSSGSSSSSGGFGGFGGGSFGGGGSSGSW